MHIPGLFIKNSIGSNDSRNFFNKKGGCAVSDVSFEAMPKAVVMLDSAQHSKDLQHFARAICPDINLKPVELEVNKNNFLVKQMSDLRKHLSEINSLSGAEKPDYIAFPGSCKVPLLNLSDQINSVYHSNIYLTPKNVENNKEQILNFLSTIADNPSVYGQNIGYMDKFGQGVEHVFGVIKEINKAVRDGIKVYLPTGHPLQDSVKWLSEVRNLKSELRHYISTGEDIGGQIEGIKSEIKNSNWYDFNLLTLSNAQSVNLQNIKEEGHLFSAFDSCVKEGARGVYNFSPVRKDDKLLGFSFLDEETLNYPIEEYAKADTLSKITKFVGLELDRVLANSKEHQAFNDYLKGYGQHRADEFTGKIFKLSDILPQEQIVSHKLKLKGDYVDSSLKLFFKENSDGKVIFPNCDCEASGRPSVVSMWGSCFSVINAIKRDMGF